jgi:hypothetical protein
MTDNNIDTDVMILDIIIKLADKLSDSKKNAAKKLETEAEKAKKDEVNKDAGTQTSDNEQAEKDLPPPDAATTTTAPVDTSDSTAIATTTTAPA